MKKLLTIFFWTCCILMAQAQMVDPIHWSAEIEELGPTANAEAVQVMIRWHAVIDKGWHLYTQDLPEDGPLPTEFTYGELILVGGTTTDAPVQSAYDENFEMTLTYYEDEATFEQIIETQDPSAIAASVTYMACNDEMCLAPTTWEITNNPAQQVNNAAEDVDYAGLGGNKSLMWIFLAGLLAGLLAIFTPCVWPIIPMTVSFFIKRADRAAKKAAEAMANGSSSNTPVSSHQGIYDAILYGLAIILIYVGLGLLVTVIFGASALNALSTNAIVNLVFFAILVVFALSFFGLFEIALPASWSTKLDQRSSNARGFLSIFFMAFTLVIVSFSCTGPIIGTLLVEAAGKSLLAPAIGMFGFALALALPFSLFAMFPTALKKMPKSGGWMTSFKVVLAFLELALSLKFLSVADMAYGWGILPRWLFLFLWILIFAACGCYLAWKIWEVSNFRKVLRAVLILASWGFTAYLIPGLFGAPVKAISAFAPPLPIEGREIFDDYEEGLAYAHQENKPILLDFTGVGCVNCRKMEAYVLSNPEVQIRLKNYVLIELYVDIKGGVGEKNSRIQQEKYGANAQPYYIQLSPNGEMISQPYAFSIDPEKFMEWLKY